jgi:hypothetical protein
MSKSFCTLKRVPLKISNNDGAFAGFRLKDK